MLIYKSGGFGLIALIFCTVCAVVHALVHNLLFVVLSFMSWTGMKLRRAFVWTDSAHFFVPNNLSLSNFICSEFVFVQFFGLWLFIYSWSVTAYPLQGSQEGRSQCLLTLGKGGWCNGSIGPSWGWFPPLILWFLSDAVVASSLCRPCLSSLVLNEC